MSVRVIVAPSIEPLTLAEVKLHLREDLSEQDDLISSLIQMAREYAERYTGRAFLTQTLQLSLPEFPSCGEIVIPRPPLQYIESIKYTDADGVEQTVDDALYQVDLLSEPGAVKPAYGEVWPAPRAGDYNAVRVRYVAGFAEIGSPSGEDLRNGVPELVKQWMRTRIAQHYEHREATVVGTIIAPLPKDYVDGLLDPLRVRRFA